jgi:hypothetical protein
MRWGLVAAYLLSVSSGESSSERIGRKSDMITLLISPDE